MKLKKGEKIVLAHDSLMEKFKANLTVSMIGPNWYKAVDSKGGSFTIKKDGKTFITNTKSLTYLHFYSPCKITKNKPKKKV